MFLLPVVEYFKIGIEDLKFDKNIKIVKNQMFSTQKLSYL